MITIVLLTYTVFVWCFEIYISPFRDFSSTMYINISAVSFARGNNDNDDISSVIVVFPTWRLNTNV